MGIALFLNIKLVITTISYYRVNIALNMKIMMQQAKLKINLKFTALYENVGKSRGKLYILNYCLETTQIAVILKIQLITNQEHINNNENKLNEVYPQINIAFV